MLVFFVYVAFTLEHSTLVIYPRALPEPLISRLTANFSSMCYVLVRETTRHSYKNSIRMHRNMALVQSTCEICECMKERGVKHTVCNFKGEGGTGQLKAKPLARFLSCYRTTPNSISQTPGELFLNRRFRMRLDLMRPDLGENVFDKQIWSD